MSRNPFIDLGFSLEEATALHVRSQLAAALEKHIDHEAWSQVEAARALKVPQPTISKIVNGNVDKLSIDFLVKLLVRAGLPVNVTGGRPPPVSRYAISVQRRKHANRLRA